MANLTATKITALDKARSSGHFADGLGLYFVVPDKGRSYWAYRYTAHGRRRQMTLGQYPYMGLADARAEVMIKKRELLAGIDPLVAKRQEAWNEIETMDDLFEDWFRQDIQLRLKHPAIPARIYKKEISPVIGDMKIAHVTSRDVREILRRIRESDRPTIANDTLMYLKQIFRHAIKLDLALNNPASAFVVKDAGGVEYSQKGTHSGRDRTSLCHISSTHEQFRVR